MFNVNFSLYSVAIILSFFSTLLVVFSLAKKSSFKNCEILGLLMCENACIIFGAKLFSFFQNYKIYNGQFNMLTTGMSSYGAVLGTILFLILFSLELKKPLKELLYIFMPSIPLMYAIGKIGCFLVGCCYGIKYNGLFKVVYKYSSEAPNNVGLFPVQIIETILFFVIFIYMMINHNRNKFNEKTLGISSILCGLAKFSLDFLRNSHYGVIFSLNQYISLFFIVVGLLVVFLYNRNQKKISK